MQQEGKRTTVQRILTGERTVAELSRELDISSRKHYRFREIPEDQAVMDQLLSALAHPDYLIEV